MDQHLEGGADIDDGWQDSYWLKRWFSDHQVTQDVFLLEMRVTEDIISWTQARPEDGAS